MNPSDSRTSLWQMSIAMALSGTIGWFVSQTGLPPLTVVWFRCALGATVLGALLLAQGRLWSPALTRSQWLWLVGGGLALVGNWLGLFTAYHYSPISLVTVVYHTQPFFLLTMAVLWQGEKLTGRRIAWLMLALLGVALIAGPSLRGGQAPLGIALALSAAVLYALATFATRQLKGVAPIRIATLQLILGALVLLPLVSLTGLSPSPRQWAAVGALGLVHTGLMYVLLYSAFQRLAAIQIATLSFLYPLVALVVDLTVFDVRLGMEEIAGGSLILLAVLANQRSGAAATAKPAAVGSTS